jgi:hypothetical protein
LAFQRILRKMVVSTHGALGAIFADFEGEAVEVVTERPFDADVHDLRVVGAYQGIAMERLRELCANAAIGEPVRFGIDFTTMHVLSCDLKDRYYLVLILDPSANEGLAWHRLLQCRDEVLREM